MLSSFGTSGTVKMELQCLSSIEIPDSSRFTRKIFVVFHGKRVKLELVNNFCLHETLLRLQNTQTVQRNAYEELEVGFKG